MNYDTWGQNASAKGASDNLNFAEVELISAQININQEIIFKWAKKLVARRATNSEKLVARLES